MSWLSEVGKKIGVREWRWDREGKKQANAVLRLHTEKAARALEAYATVVERSEFLGEEVVLREAHRAIEKLNLPVYVLMLIGPVLESLDVSRWLLEANVAAANELREAATRVRGARL
jgi:hypothetical protein